MLGEGKKRHPWMPFTAGDATRLPFRDEAFDAVTISFGLRNVQDTEAALREMHRVTAPGGRVVICEFSHPMWAPFRTVYTEYLMRALPPVARAVSSSPDAYVYLAESIRAWPDQAELGRRLQRRGLGEGGLAQPDRRRRGAAPGAYVRRSVTVLRAVRPGHPLPARPRTPGPDVRAPAPLRRCAPGRPGRARTGRTGLPRLQLSSP